MQRLARLLVMVSCLVPTLLIAGTIRAPKLVPGKYVYAIPPNFSPPMIGSYGMQQIQGAASKLHFPFYVILVKTLPGQGDKAAADAVNGLAEDWTSDPRYNVGRSSIFLLSYNPRKYRFLAGATWKNRFDLHNDALLPYLDIFVASVTGTPKDPKSGIINMMREFDGYLWEQMDPVKIAARAKAKRAAERQHMLEQAQSRLQHALDDFSKLLISPAIYYPADIQRYRDNAFSAMNTLGSDDINEINPDTSGRGVQSRIGTHYSGESRTNSSGTTPPDYAYCLFSPHFHSHSYITRLASFALHFEAEAFSADHFRLER